MFSGACPVVPTGKKRRLLLVHGTFSKSHAFFNGIEARNWDALQFQLMVFLLITMVGVIAALAVGGGAYCFGFARYTTTPGVLELSAAAAQEKIEKAGLEYAEGDPAYSEDVAKGLVIAGAGVLAAVGVIYGVGSIVAVVLGWIAMLRHGQVEPGRD